MPTIEESPASPKHITTSHEDLAYYKSQYEALEAELADFQASSRELESELEKDIEASEKRERQLQQKLDNLRYEVDEWKTKYKQAKSEANSAQNTLQKEVTSLRDANRTLQLKLRDMEVANDDYERQTRNTTTSLEDLESKYNVALERGVMLEEEMRSGEQEREQLRIETQRLRDELSDLKVEADITQEKLRHAEASIRHPRLNSKLTSVQAPYLETSPSTSTSSPLTTPPAKSSSSEMPTPPSPPISESSTNAPSHTSASSVSKSKLSACDSSLTPRPSRFSSRAPGHGRAPSYTVSSGHSSISVPRRHTRDDGTRTGNLPHSGSLFQIRGLIGKMQKLEERVQSARSKLPAPSRTGTPSQVSPRNTSSLSQATMPPGLTVRGHRKRTGSSTVSGSSSMPDSEETPSTRRSSRVSLGIPQTPLTIPESYTSSLRPDSRASASTRTSISHGMHARYTADSSRPSSRQGISRTRTPVSHYPSKSGIESRRIRSSAGGHYNTIHSHNHSMTVSNINEADTVEVLMTAPRRATFSRDGMTGSAIPTPGGYKKRHSGGGGNNTVTLGERKFSSRISYRERDKEIMPPPERRPSRLSDLGETY